MASSTGPPRRMRVLVVEDEPDTLRSLQDLLEGGLPGVEVLAAASGTEALQMLERGPVDLILSDFRMANMNGLDLLVTARERAPQVTRLLMTAYPDLDLALAAINDGHVSGFYQKPIEPVALIETVRAWLADREEAARQAQERAARALAAASALRETSPGSNSRVHRTRRPKA